MCCLLVSGFLTEITQQIHSLRASGVISSHFALATGSEMRTFRKSAGKPCTAPEEIAFLVMDFILPCCAISPGSALIVITLPILTCRILGLGLQASSAGCVRNLHNLHALVRAKFTPATSTTRVSS
jgi:hypothetical protein